MQSGAACFVRISRAISLTQPESRWIAKISHFGVPEKSETIGQVLDCGWIIDQLSAIFDFA